MLGKILSKFDQILKRCVPTTSQDDKYNPIQSLITHDHAYFCTIFLYLLSIYFVLTAIIFESLMQNVQVYENYSKWPDTAP